MDNDNKGMDSPNSQGSGSGDSKDLVEKKFDEIKDRFNKSVNNARSGKTSAKNPADSSRTERSRRRSSTANDSAQANKSTTARLTRSASTENNSRFSSAKDSDVILSEEVVSSGPYDAETKRKYRREREIRKDRERRKPSMAKSQQDSIPPRKKKKQIKKLKKKARFRAIKWIITILAILIVGALVTGCVYVYSIVKDTPKYDATEIESKLKQTSTLYDDEGNEMQDLFLDGGNRTIVTFDQIPEHTLNAFVAIEDKTFWEHKGFNIVRIIGAVRESLVEGTDIAGTSTISQQLARNLWLAESRTDRTLDRKLKEAFYAYEMEKTLSKKQIITNYLNTIALGNNSYGLQAAALSYFDKDVSELDLIESAALATIPKSPKNYAIMHALLPDSLDDDSDIIDTRGEYYYVFNPGIQPRLELVLKNMFQQGLITQEEYDAALEDNIRDHLVVPEAQGDDVSSYFVSYAIDNIAEDLFEQFPDLGSTDNAVQMIYSGGLKIYTTFNQRIQSILDEAYSNPDNFQGNAGIRRDSAGNILDEGGKLIVYDWDNMFVDWEGETWFNLHDDEYDWLDDGSLRIFKGNRLHIYNTTTAAGDDVSIEFKDFYTTPEGKLHLTKGGVIRIPMDAKSTNDEGDLIISKAFLDSEENCFVFDEDGPWIGPKNFTLRQSVVQPQSAMVVLENATGQIKGMIGGRDVEGQMNYNRAVNPRQPGSTMKTIGTYAPAIEMTARGEPVGSSTKTYGEYWSPLSIIEDKELVFEGKVWPKNWYGGYRGPTSMRVSLEQSMNVNAVKVQLEVGNQRSVDFLEKLGISTLVTTKDGGANDLNPSALALGGMTRGITPLDITSAYSSFPNGGVRVSPITYTSILDNMGNVVLDGTPEETKVMDPGTAFIMVDMLRTTVTNGIGSGANISGIPVAGKTGTTSDNYDDWFVGFTPKYAAGVWIGNDVNISMTGEMTKAMFRRVMSQVCEGVDQGEYPSQPENIVRASVSGRSDYFFKNTVPKSLNYGSGGDPNATEEEPDDEDTATPEPTGPSTPQPIVNPPQPPPPPVEPDPPVAPPVDDPPPAVDPPPDPPPVVPDPPPDPVVPDPPPPTP